MELIMWIKWDVKWIEKFYEKRWLNWKVIKVYNEILIINHIVKNKRIYELCDPNYNYFLSCEN